MCKGIHVFIYLQNGVFFPIKYLIYVNQLSVICLLNFSFPRQSQKARLVLLDGYRFLGLFWKVKYLSVITDEVSYTRSMSRVFSFHLSVFSSICPAVHYSICSFLLLHFELKFYAKFVFFYL